MVIRRISSKVKGKIFRGYQGSVRSRPRVRAGPFLSPLGIAGALVAAAIASVTLVTLFFNPAYNKGVIGAAAWFLLGILYFALRGRHQLVLAPEEKFAERL